jgi:hypothetical protein
VKLERGVLEVKPEQLVHEEKVDNEAPMDNREKGKSPYWAEMS